MHKPIRLIFILGFAATSLVLTMLIYRWQSGADNFNCGNLTADKFEDLFTHNYSKEQLQAWIMSNNGVRSGDINISSSSLRSEVLSFLWKENEYVYEIIYSDSQIKSVAVTLPRGLFASEITGRQIIQCLGAPREYRLEYVEMEARVMIYQIWYPHLGVMLEGTETLTESEPIQVSEQSGFNEYTFTRPKLNGGEMAIEILYGYPDDYQDKWINSFKSWTGSWEALRIPK